MLRLQENLAFLLSRAQRNGRHGDLYVYYLKNDFAAVHFAHRSGM
jgi:hypothetical protein